MKSGDCFYNKSVRGVPSHPWVIVSDPELDSDNVLIVNLTDADKHDDTSCVVTSAEVAWLTKTSCLAYQYAKLTSIAALEAANQQGLLFNQQVVTPEVLDMIREGAVTSDELKNDFKELLRSQGLA